MKIIILNHYQRLAPRVELETRALHQAGHELSVFNWRRDAGDAAQMPAPAAGFAVNWLDVPSPKASAGIVRALPRLYREIATQLAPQEFDVIHCTHFLLLPASIRVAEKKGAQVVYDAYERYASDIAHQYFPGMRGQVCHLLEAAENRLVKRVDGVLTISSPGEILATRYMRNCGNVEVLYNVPAAGAAAVRSLREQYAGRNVMIYAGTMTRNTGIFRLAETVALLRDEFPEVLLLMIGDFDSPGDEATFRDRVRLDGLERNIELIPWMPFERLMEHASLARIGIAPYQRHPRYLLLGKGTARKIFTYMCAGLPVISSDFGEVARIVAEERCGILADTSSAAAVAAAARRLLRDGDAAAAMGAKGRAAVREKYNWEQEQAKLLRLYERVAGR